MADTEDTREPPTTPPVGMVTVYDKQGTPHTMSRLNAWDMIQHCGWANRIVKAVEAEAKRVVVLVSKTAPVLKDAEAEEVDLATLALEDLKAFALKHFEMKFDAKATKESIIAAIVNERGT